MTEDDKPDFARILNGLALLKRTQLHEDALDMWWLTMQSWPLDEFTAAASHLATSCQFMPTPYDFHELRKAGRMTAMEAWDRALHHAASSAYRNGPLGDALIDHAVRCIGGYRAIAMCEDEKLGFLEKRFHEAFETKQDAEDIREALPAIAPRPQLNGSSGPRHLLAGWRSSDEEPSRH